jgi:hypothetical protein
VVSGVAALVGIVIAARIDPESVTMPLYPLAWPAVPIAAVVGALLALAPAFVAPRSPALRAPEQKDPPSADVPTQVEVLA